MMRDQLGHLPQAKQRELAQAIKRARFLALLPYVVKTTGNERD